MYKALGKLCRKTRNNHVNKITCYLNPELRECIVCSKTLKATEKVITKAQRGRFSLLFREYCECNCTSSHF